MRHLRKYNESRKDFDKDFFTSVFVDFIDEDAEVTFTETYYEIVIQEPKIDYYPSSIDQYLRQLKVLSDFYLDIKACIARIEDEYPLIRCDFNLEESGQNNAWENTIEKTVRLTFDQPKPRKPKAINIS